MNSRNRFSLVELLAIVSVLAIIGSLFFAFKDKLLYQGSSSRDKGRRIACTSNLKQIGLTIRIYSQDNKDEFPFKSGRSGFEMLRSGGYLTGVKVYVCPNTKDIINDNYDLSSSSVSYEYASGLNESTSVDSGLAIDRDYNHNKYGNILFCDGHVAGFAGTTWSVGNTGGSSFGW